ncbi:MAG: glycoside hydrolase family 28 protein [Lachnospira sp.]|nr:glycoside hydrolase family 28 protein [Lachnospira sp.]
MIRDITEFGAVGDGSTKNTVAIQKAIDAVAEAGGGTVNIPAGTFLSGSLRLRSHIELHLSTGARLVSSLDPDDIIDFMKDFDDDNADTGWEGGVFLFARHEEDITISGNGTIDGQGRLAFWDDDADGGLHECPLAVRGFRPRMSFLEDVRRLTVRDVTFEDSAYWTLHMAGCQDVLIENIRILNNERGANNDGIDPDCCRNVVIRGCIIRTGDDCVVVKTTAPMTRKYGGTENIVISGCTMRSRSCALKIGTETWGDIHHVVFSDCVLSDCTRGFGIISRDGGAIHDILIHHVTGNTRRYSDCTSRDTGVHVWWGKGDPLFISATRRAGTDRIPGKISRVFIDHLYMDGEGASLIAGEDESPVQDVHLSDVVLRMKRQSSHIPDVFDEMPSARGVYRHEMAVLYTRCARNCTFAGQLEIDGSMKQFCKSKRIDE